MLSTGSPAVDDLVDRGRAAGRRGGLPRRFADRRPGTLRPGGGTGGISQAELARRVGVTPSALSPVHEGDSLVAPQALVESCHNPGGVPAVALWIVRP